MNRSLKLLAVTAVLLVVGASASIGQSVTLSFGPGNKTCADWQAATGEDVQVLHGWVLGYMSGAVAVSTRKASIPQLAVRPRGIEECPGMNSVRPSICTQRWDDAALLALVDEQCSAAPSQPLSAAAENAAMSRLIR
jgi:hypothetical protein